MSFIKSDPPESIWVSAKWKNNIISWYWSGFLWYCTKEYRDGPLGCGKTKDDAFIDFKNQLKGQG